jgi:hypothetical protein
MDFKLKRAIGVDFKMKKATGMGFKMKKTTGMGFKMKKATGMDFKMRKCECRSVANCDVEETIRVLRAISCLLPSSMEASPHTAAC